MDKHSENNQIRVLLAEPKNKEHFDNEKALKSMKNVILLPSVGNGNDVLKILEAEKVDLLLLDLLVSGIDGIKVMRDMQQFENVPVTILVTPITSELLINESAKLGAIYSFSKPFDSQIAMERAIEIYLDIKKLNPIFLQRPAYAGRWRTLIVNYLRELGTPAHLLGYKYLVSAIEYCVARDGFAKNVTTEIYPHVAKTYNSTPQKVERSTRNAIELTWNNGNFDVIESAFGVSAMNERPSNSEFIAKSSLLIMDQIASQHI